MTSLRIGTRGSPLALWQAHHVADMLRAAAPEVTLELVEIQTAGDQVRDVPLSQMGGEGVFTKAIQQALQENRVDVAVHSLKDLPTFTVANVLLAASAPESAVQVGDGVRGQEIPPSADFLLRGGRCRFGKLCEGVLNCSIGVRILKLGLTWRRQT